MQWTDVITKKAEDESQRIREEMTQAFHEDFDLWLNDWMSGMDIYFVDSNWRDQLKSVDFPKGSLEKQLEFKGIVEDAFFKASENIIYGASHKEAGLKKAVKQVPVTVYEFQELEPKAKERAKQDWYDLEDYPMLSDDLTEFVKEKLTQNQVIANDGPDLQYSLSYSQGDGLMFTGQFQYKDINIKVSHFGHYSHSNSASFDFTNDGGDDIEGDDAYTATIEEFKSLYKTICKEAKKAGYEEIDYRMDDNEFAEHCEANGYNFYENGKMANL